MSEARVVHLVEALELGGLEGVVRMLARHASPAYRVQVIAAARGGPLVAELLASGTPVRVLGARNYYPADVLKTARVLAAIAPHVVHTHGHFAGVLGRAAAWWARVPVIVHHLHTLDSTLKRRHRHLERTLARATARIVCCSRAVERHATEILGLPRERTLTIYNGIDPPPPTDRAEASRRLGGPARPIVGSVGGLSQHKGQEVLIRAWLLLPRTFASGTIVLIGDGPERGRLERVASDLGIRDRVLVLGERLDARHLLPAFDLTVVPSLKREGLGLAALEAMDAGCPVIASRVGGLGEVVEEGQTGLLVPPSDPVALAAAIREVLERPDQGRALGTRGRKRVESLFRATAMARRVESLYEEALGERRAA